MEEKKDQVVLAIDCGTGGIRAILFDALGNQLEQSKITFRDYYSLEMNWKEAKPEMFWEGLLQAVKQLIKKNPIEFSKIKAMTVACQRDVITVVDEKGEPLRDFISWMDRRELEKPLAYSWPHTLLFKMTGFTGYADSFSKTCHAHWIKVKEPQVWEKAHKLVFLSTYLITKLTGRIVESRSSVAGHVPFNTRKKEWCTSPEIKADILKIEPRMRFDLIDSCQVIGNLTREAAEQLGLKESCPVVSSGTDKGCETLGVGGVTPKIASISLGTQATLEVTTKKYVEIYPFYPAFPAVSKAGYNPEITIYHGFWMVDWFIEEFFPGEDKEKIFPVLETFLKETSAGSEGLVHQPYWGREAFHPEGRGSLIGFTEGHDRRHIYRAFIEGLGYALLEGVRRIEKKTKVPISEIGISGGGSKSDEVMQIMADIFGRPVFRVQTNETTGLGAAMAAFVGLGIYRTLDEAVEAMVKRKKVFYPDGKNQLIYSKIYREIYRKLYRQLKPLYLKY